MNLAISLGVGRDPMDRDHMGPLMAMLMILICCFLCIFGDVSQVLIRVLYDSLQDFSQGELTVQTDRVRHQINDETQRRERILDVKRSLAQEVVLKSKEDAGQLATIS